VLPTNRDREDETENWAQSVPRELHRALVVDDLPDFPIVRGQLSGSALRELQSGRTEV
jgi:hypothetical protein